jgi:translation initiation factor IF-2
MAGKTSKKTSTAKINLRPPMVAVLGHVDHGKTSLLDKIRQTSLAVQEAGGITQHIGAYQIDYQGQKITFIDTPGHVAFSKMRSRGAKVADLAVLVVAADEGVKPQTLESYEHIQKAKIPFLVAINKIDLPTANVNRVKKELAENNLLVEGFGGEIVAVPVSAKTGEGVAPLLEMILLLGEMAELKSKPEGELTAVVVESKMDQKKGPLATVLISNGSLRIGDWLKVENYQAKIRGMRDDKGKTIKVALPSQPVEIMGFKEVLPVGAKVEKSMPEKQVSVSLDKKVSSDSLKTELDKDEQKLKVILKTDVGGTLEAIQEALPSEVQLILGQPGDISESDVLMAVSTGAEIIGFNVKISSSVKKLAETEGVKIKTYKIIYELLEEIEKRILKILEPTIDEKILGQAEIIAEFKIGSERIAGGKVTKGVISKQAKLHLQREGQILADTQIKSMRIGKQTVEKVSAGEEFGVILGSQIDFRVGDVLISYTKVEE